MGGMSTIGTLAKTLQKVTAFVLGQSLKKKRGAVVAVTPGFLRSEAMLEHFKVTEATWRKGGRKDKHFLESETPRFLGRGVAAMAADFFFSGRRRHTMCLSDWSSDVCSSDLDPRDALRVVIVKYDAKEGKAPIARRGRNETAEY